MAGILRKPFLCPICGAEFQGPTKRKQQLDHIRTEHPRFWDWRDGFNKKGYVLGAVFVLFLVVGAFLQTTGGSNAVPTWYPFAFLGLVAILLAMIPYWTWGVRGFKREWTSGSSA